MRGTALAEEELYSFKGFAASTLQITLDIRA